MRILEKYKNNLDFIPYPKRMIGFSLTNQCNLNCIMCWQKKRKTPVYLSFDSIKKVIEAISGFSRPTVYLWGGEPFLHPQLWEIIAFVKSKNMFSIVNSNGILIEENIKNILDSRLDMLIVSIDGILPVHDRIRGKNGTFQKIVNGLINLKKQKKHRPLIVLNCVINEYNYEMLDEISEIKNAIEADYMEFQFMMFYSEQEIFGYKKQFCNYFGYEPSSADFFPKDKGNINLKKLADNILSVRKRNDSHIRFFPYFLKNFEDIVDYYEQPTKLSINQCENISKSLWIEPNGDVIPCSAFPDFVAGNINQEDFFTIWNGDKFSNFRSALNKKLFPICYRCCDLYKTDLFQAKRD